MCPTSERMLEQGSSWLEQFYVIDFLNSVLKSTGYTQSHKENNKSKRVTVSK